MQLRWSFCLALAACAAESADPAPVDPDEPTVSFFGRVRAFDPADPFSTAGFIVGAEVCLVGGDCSTTESDGSYLLHVPPNAEFTVRYSAEGYGTTDYLTTTDDSSRELGFYMASDQLLADFYAQCASTFPEVDTAAILITGYRDVAGKVTFLDGGAITATAGRACYFSGGFLHDDPAQLTTTADGFGSVALHNVPVDTGAIDVALTAGGLSCDHRSVPVERGITTLVELACR